ncbi:MAG: HD-GYP domain-containing protein [Planctomycetaceae bacterium]
MATDVIRRIRKHLSDDRLVLELLLIGSVVGLATLVAVLHGNSMVALNLFYLPVVLAGFFLGRYRAGVMAFLCVVAGSLAIAWRLDGPGGPQSVVVVGLMTLVWAAALCLTAMLVGSLSDERNAKVRELHEAYVGVVEVLSKYLRSANPRLKDRATRVAELCQRVASELRLMPQETDDIRVAALMVDLGKIEVTTRLVSRAVDTLESNQDSLAEHSFQGIDLVHSLGSVLRGAIPLLADQGDSLFGAPGSELDRNGIDTPIGARIIRVARVYDALTAGRLSQDCLTPDEALARLDRDGAFAGDVTFRWAFERALTDRRRRSRATGTPGQSDSEMPVAAIR